jgi:hypothetical protein
MYIAGASALVCGDQLLSLVRHVSNNYSTLHDINEVILWYIRPTNISKRWLLMHPTPDQATLL